MKTINQISLLLFCLGFLYMSYAQKDVTQKKKLIVIIDPGHGGTDAGAITKNSVKEKDIVLSIASKILILSHEIYENPLEIYMTRYTDTLVSLGHRAQLAKKLKADLFVSLHCNHSDNPNAKGVEVYASMKQGGYSEESVFLGYQIEKALCKEIGYESRGVKFANFQVLRETVDYCTSILLELGFLSNEDESRYVSGIVNTKLIASIILKSIEL